MSTGEDITLLSHFSILNRSKPNPAGMKVDASRPPQESWSANHRLNMIIG